MVSENAVSCVREGLRLVDDREDDIEHCSDDLSVGPIYDVDDGAASRATWWRRVHANRMRFSPKVFDDIPQWKRIVTDDRNVVLWTSSHPAEYLLALRACWFLRRSPSRVFEVRLASSVQPPPARFGISMAGPRGVAAAWPNLRRVREVGRRAERWPSSAPRVAMVFGSCGAVESSSRRSPPTMRRSSTRAPHAGQPQSTLLPTSFLRFRLETSWWHGAFASSLRLGLSKVVDLSREG